MNDSKKDQSIDEYMAETMANDAELERLKDEVALKKAKLDQNKYTQQLNQLEQDKKDLKIAEGLNYGQMSKEQIEKMQSGFSDYMRAAKKKMRFIISDFDKYVPFFRSNLILIGAHTGKGKSTAAANIAFSVLNQTNPETGKKYRCLIITNEEKAEDFYNRVTFLYKSWHYVNHDEFTDEQTETCKRAIAAFGSTGNLRVVDDSYGGSHGVTTSLEGIEAIFENLLANNELYDVIIIDYYQNIISSKKNPYLNEYLVQATLARMLDQYKNRYPAPLVLLAQVDPQTEDDRRTFKQRICGRKLILDQTTLAIELTTDYQKRATEWTFWKSRFTESVGKSVWTGYDKGRFVSYSEEFRNKIQSDNDKIMKDKLDKEMNKSNGIPDAFKKKEENNE